MSGANTETDSEQSIERSLPAGDVESVDFPPLSEVHPEQYPEAAKHAGEAGIPVLDTWYAVDGRLGSPVAINEVGVVAVAYADAEGLEYEPAWRFEDDSESVHRVPRGVVENPEEVIEDYLSQHISDDLGTLGGGHSVNGYGDAETVRDVELASLLTTVVANDPAE
ncbi:MAG: hypothetical protein ACI9CA_000436 [Natronomonas sp.]|jgi:hypothetical protein